ncbi:16S rRNA (guanine(527)-N(7))-methyltransferase RsmG [Janibacter sp. GXQ6167]|uniref:16S rRNA (guanine(527)-N(7))-methyltransferase RsmG n=1 Tax=Janibacter sp. GXQ6167 TaxID=3240791 RepID=UPI00352517ED
MDHPPEIPEAALRFFGDRRELAERFVAHLADTGVSHGLIGPREVPILWERHVLNCAVIEDAFPSDERVIDVGSGAGLPGLAIAIARPDLTVDLVEPMQRRTEWLQMVTDDLGLDRVTVHRARAEEVHGVLSAPFVTARAVARIDKLARWCFPLVSDGGQLIAMKGRSAPEELTAATPVLRRLGMSGARISEHGGDVLDEPTLTMDLTVQRKRASRAGHQGRK